MLKRGKNTKINVPPPSANYSKVVFIVYTFHLDQILKKSSIFKTYLSNQKSFFG